MCAKDVVLCYKYTYKLLLSQVTYQSLIISYPETFFPWCRWSNSWWYCARSACSATDLGFSGKLLGNTLRFGAAVVSIPPITTSELDRNACISGHAIVIPCAGARSHIFLLAGARASAVTSFIAASARIIRIYQDWGGAVDTQSAVLATVTLTADANATATTLDHVVIVLVAADTKIAYNGFGATKDLSGFGVIIEPAIVTVATVSAMTPTAAITTAAIVTTAAEFAVVNLVFISNNAE